MYSLLNLIFCIDVCDELNENIKNKVIAARDNFDVNLNVVENVIDDVINVWFNIIVEICESDKIKILWFWIFLKNVIDAWFNIDEINTKIVLKINEINT